MTDIYHSNIAPAQSGTVLFIVDPQNDFHPGGSLAIPSANADAKRIADFLRANKDKVSAIMVTMDTHSLFHIAHPLFWVDQTGAHPEPFTVITVADFEAGKWKPSRSEFTDWAKFYLQELERQKRFVLCIWPPHCLVGSPGHNVVPEILEALQEWEAATKSCVKYIFKGNNSLTEHYSGLKAEVARDDDQATLLNQGLLDELSNFDRVVLCGQAKSHCVNFTVRDLADHWDSSNLASLVLLEDGSSSVPGFEEAGEKFVEDMTAKGLTIASCDLRL